MALDIKPIEERLDRIHSLGEWRFGYFKPRPQIFEDRTAVVRVLEHAGLFGAESSIISPVVFNDDGNGAVRLGLRCDPAHQEVIENSVRDMLAMLKEIDTLRDEVSRLRSELGYRRAEESK